MKLLKKITDKDFGGTNEALSAKLRRIKVRAVLLDENDNMALMYMPKFRYNDYNDLYMIPGGGIEANEDLEKALEREMLEETGCRFNIIEELGYIEEHSTENDSFDITYYYLAKIIGEKGQTQMVDYEIEAQTEVQWHTLEKSLYLITNEVAVGGIQSIKLRDKIVMSEVIKRLRK
jgi:ADP-ribose pyrophosphatase YjhB (NUDIX family)